MIAFYLPGGLAVYTFSMLIGLGAVIGLGWSYWLASKKVKPNLIDAGIYVLVGSLVGSRIGYVAVNWTYFNRHWLEIPQVQSGGLTWIGAVLGCIISLGVYSHVKHIVMGELTDALLPLALTISVSCWLGSWLDGIYYGDLTNSWWGLPMRDEWGVTSKRIPLQLIGVLAMMFTMWFVEKSMKWEWIPRWVVVPGRASLLIWMFLSLELIGLSFLRHDPVQSWQGLHLDTWACIASTSTACIWLISLAIRPIIKNTTGSALDFRQEET